jgi:secreted PhoX family phosphatase
MKNVAGVAVDLNGNVWAANDFNPGSITELSGSTGAVMGSSPFSGGGVNEPDGIAVDGSGNVWTANFGEGSSGSLSEFTNGGVAISGTNGYSVGGSSSHSGFGIDVAVAIDPGENGWAADNYEGALDKFNSSGALQSGFLGYGASINDPTGLAFDSTSRAWVSTHGSNVQVVSDNGSVVVSYTGGGLNLSQGIAIDGGGNAWITNSKFSLTNPGLLSEFNTFGTALTPSTGFTTSTLINPSAIAVDGSGDVWVTNNGNSSVSEFIGAGVPVVTPLATGVANNTLGTRP